MMTIMANSFVSFVSFVSRDVWLVFTCQAEVPSCCRLSSSSSWAKRFETLSMALCKSRYSLYCELKSSLYRLRCSLDTIRWYWCVYSESPPSISIFSVRLSGLLELGVSGPSVDEVTLVETTVEDEDEDDDDDAGADRK